MAYIDVAPELISELRVGPNDAPMTVLEVLQKALLLPWPIANILVCGWSLRLFVNAPEYGANDRLSLWYRRGDSGITLDNIEVVKGGADS